MQWLDITAYCEDCQYGVDSWLYLEGIFSCAACYSNCCLGHELIYCNLTMMIIVLLQSMFV